MSLDRPTRSIRLKDRTSEDRLQDKHHMRRTKLIIQNLYDNVYLATFGKKFISDHPLAG